MQRLKFPGRPHLVVVFIASGYFPHEKRIFCESKVQHVQPQEKGKKKQRLKKNKINKN